VLHEVVAVEALQTRPRCGSPRRASAGSRQQFGAAGARPLALVRLHQSGHPDSERRDLLPQPIDANPAVPFLHRLVVHKGVVCSRVRRGQGSTVADRGGRWRQQRVAGQNRGAIHVRPGGTDLLLSPEVPGADFLSLSFETHDLGTERVPGQQPDPDGQAEPDDEHRTNRKTFREGRGRRYRGRPGQALTRPV
jgi:hypothetical protein